MGRINPDQVVGRPGWLCEHRMCRDICPRCSQHLEDWVALADAKEPEGLMKKAELAEAFRVWTAGQGIEVSDCDGPSFIVKLPTGDEEDEDAYQVYRVTFAIPRDKNFVLAEDWWSHQNPTDDDLEADPTPGKDDDQEDTDTDDT